jgi:hypothetical protein
VKSVVEADPGTDEDLGTLKRPFELIRVAEVVGTSLDGGPERVLTLQRIRKRANPFAGGQ